MIAIIDYNTGNLRSVVNAVRRAGAEYVLTADPRIIERADRVLLPGVGEASSAMANLRATGLDEVIPRLTMPVLGICIGVQLMCAGSEEGNVRTMGIFPTEVRRFEADKQQGIKVPHMGWNRIEQLKTPLFDGVAEGSWIYYVHSFAPDLCDYTVARTTYGREFSGALARDNFFGTQFHPEKSGSVGARIIENFIKL
ncbi:MAG: imidazole glycerol phosphate synthase subunit HisH [Rikenellaceae bacterium]|nr:imidazole glycerol phosphate synthase subunit HisH [Rikenellaceae bacterium]MBR2332926.1 imidazole glycerol phosphate synthase subunit HisH [Rikenellaceae bacterium]MBR2452308.1 imidazole glycerol phosphate synthase subunit HisH [Rikenellaceae bacterium]